MFALFTAAALLALPFSAAIITPTSPDSHTVVKVGDPVEALWTVDSTDSWTNVEIQLMTGDNLAMIPLATVATGIDGTSASSFSFAAPDVSPYAKIYFLQFTNGGDTTDVTWTTRFTIAGADGATTEPTNSTVYSGSSVQWGTGTLLSTIPTDASNATESTTASAAATIAPASTVSVSSTAETLTETLAQSTAEASSAASASTTATLSSARAGVSTAAAAVSSSAASGAGRLHAGLAGGVLAALVGAALL